MQKKKQNNKTQEEDKNYQTEGRVYKGTVKFNHDLYKLHPNDMKKNISFNQIPRIENITHMHFFHTVNSDGKKQETSTMIGGHFHRMKIEYLNDTDPPKVTCDSGPLTYATRQIMGRNKRVEVPTFVDEMGNVIDDHRHDVEYMRSEVISMRQVNQEAVKARVNFETNERQNLTPPQGVSVS